MNANNDNTPSKPLLKSSNFFPVVGIGASAGGLDAFRKLLKAIPEDSGMAYVLVQHLHPQHESLLPELLQKVTTIPVLEVTNDVKVAPNHIYIIPSNKLLIANDGVLELSPRTAENRTMPIDLFFNSLAEVHQSHAIGVVLSGTASDGTQGLKSIKEHGGITLAQDEASSAYTSMPVSAIQAGVVDFILPPEQIPEKLMEITHRISRNIGDDPNNPMTDDDAFKQILLLLRVRKGTDFTFYKQTTIRRRILRRMLLNKKEEPKAYLEYLRENKSEQDVLYQDLLIPVTGFFRDDEIFEMLCQSILPQVVKNKTNDEPIRIWVAGCSTGEEAYSLAICLREFLGARQDKVQIFASDISEPAILKARAGNYTKSDVEKVSPERLKEFFTKISGGYHIIREIREMCVFAVHNFLKDPPFGKMDLICCRNVLIYMEPYLQKKALTTFHYALSTNALLLLGKSETASSVDDLFTSVSRNTKLFKRKDGPGKLIPITSRQREEKLRDTNLNVKGTGIRTDFQKTADEIMLSKYTPAGVVVNEAMDIVHFRGSTGAYLEQAPGKPSLNLFKMAKNGLGFELRNILHKVKKENEAVAKENIPIDVMGSQRVISIEAIPLPNMVEPHFLILFHDAKAIGTKQTAKAAGGKSSVKTPGKRGDGNRIQQLERELLQTREDMRSITEDQEAVNEELQSANEELFSSSEELQSLNEELETSKEELQSTIEELTVVNQEMKSLNEQLTYSKEYAEGIIATLREPLIVMDKSFRIRTANKSFYKTFMVNQRETEGQLIYELGNKQWDIPQLRKLLEAVLPEKESFFDFEVEHNFPVIGQRTMLLNAHEMAGAGAEKFILVAFEDITQEKESAIHRSLISAIVDSSDDAIISTTLEGIILTWNKGAEKIFGYNEQEAIGEQITFIIPPDLRQEEEMAIGQIRNGQQVTHFDTIRMAKDGKRINISLTISPIKNSDGNIIGASNIGRDVTSEKEVASRLKQSEENFRQLAELTPEKITSADAAGNIIYYNKRWFDYIGKSFEKMENWGWNKVVHPDDLQELIKRWTHSLATGDDLEMEARFGDKNGNYKWHLTRAIAVKTHDGKIDKWIGTTTEIQHQKEQRDVLENSVAERTHELFIANKELTQKNDSLEKLNHDLESFNYVSSHDMQEPLRKIQIFANKILESEYSTLSNKGRDSFVRIQDAAKRMQTLIQDLLSYSRTTNVELKFKKTNLTMVVENVKSEFEETIQEKNAIIEIHDLCTVNVIPFQFHQMMYNLIGNALKFSDPHRQPHILVKSELIMAPEVHGLSPEKRYCHITVSDNGVGFEQKYNDKIFEMFQRLYGQDEFPGTGIGLSIVKKIVTNHSGIVSATGKLNEGATFDIYIPDEVL